MSDPKHISYTTTDIERYHSGSMSKAEMHAMEKAALEDPFLADALEGFSYSKDMRGELAELHNRFEEKTEPKVIPITANESNFGWMRIAALFIVLAGAGWVIFKMDNGDAEKELAVQKSQAPAETMADAKTADTSDLAIENANQEETYVPVIKEDPMIASAPKTRSLEIGKSVSAPRSIEMPQAETEIKDSVYRLDTKADEVAAVSTEVNKAASYLREPRMNQVTGIVTDENRNAIPFASVILRNYTGTLTDNQGRFQMAVPDTARNMDVAALGYNTRNVNIRETKANEPIVLEELPGSYTTMTIAKERRNSRSQKQSIIEIGELEPESGWYEYNSYITEKLRPPNTKQVKNTSRTVQLSFDVDENGNPVNIAIVKSLCEACDQEAIRLLKEGPKWKKQQGKGKITIRF